MTAKKNLKRRVRARQERTGEPYTVALENVRAAQPPIRVIELISLTESAARLGLKCDVRAFPELLAQVDPGVLLLRVRDALITADGDRRLRTMRRVALLGEAAPPPESPVFPGGRFIEGARAGQEGPSQDGRLLIGSLLGAAVRPSPPAPLSRKQERGSRRDAEGATNRPVHAEGVTA